MKIGVGVTIITPQSPMLLAAYFDRVTPSVGTHDELKARTIYVSHDGVESAIIACDLLAIGNDVAADIRDLALQTLGIPGANIMVTATHTHQGPAGLSKYLDDVYPAFLTKQVVESIAMAQKSAQEGSFRFVESELKTVSQNRRDPEGPIEEVMKVLVATDTQSKVIASVMAYACHPTILESDNYHFSADFPGPANDLMERNLGGVSIYLQGMCGDINPTWTEHDQDGVKLNGEIVGATALRVALESLQLGTDRRSVNLSWGIDTPQINYVGHLLTAPGIRSAQRYVHVDRDYPTDLDTAQAEMASIAKQLEDDPSLANKKKLTPRLMELYGRDDMWKRKGPRRGPGSDDLEIQAIAISSDCVFLGLPGEFLVEVGSAIQARSPFKSTIIVGYANGYYEYFPLSKHFEEHGYEVGSSRYTQGSTEKIIDASIELLKSL
jgi:neutral ceramidase